MPVRQRVDRSAEHIAGILTFVANDLNQPIRLSSQELRIAQTTLWCCVSFLGLHPYKIMLTQELKPMDHSALDAIGLLKIRFGACVISRSGPINWLPCSLFSLLLCRQRLYIL